MLSVRLVAQRKLELFDDPPPKIRSGEVLVRVTAVGICGSDLHWFEDGNIGDDALERPLVLGHEFAGIIEAGRGEGTRVAVDPAVNCEACRYCLEGNPNLCEHIRFSGHGHQDGALRQFIAWPERLLHPLPSTLSDDDGAMLEPLGVAIHAVDLAKVREGDSVAVFGCGPIGLLILQVARSRGARIPLATDLRSHRLHLATRFGAEQTFQTGVPESAAALDVAASDLDIDVAVEASTSNLAVQDAVRLVRPGGRVVLCGIPSENQISFDASVARRKGLTIALVRRMKHTYPRAIDLVTSGRVDVRSIVSDTFPLRAYDEAFRKAVSRSGHKVVIYPNDD